MPRKRSVVQDIVRHALAETPAVEKTPCRCLPTGSTLLNLAVSDRADGGWGAGKVGNLVGDSNTGKTLLAMSGLMEMALDPAYDDYDLIADDAEHALEMDVEAMFGPQLASRLQDPFGHFYGDPEWANSNTIQEVKNTIWSLLKAKRRFIYILDSYDALTSKEELSRQEEESKGKEMNRDYPRGPAVLGEMLRKIKQPLADTGSYVLIISQTRDVMDAVSFGAQKRRAGGKALKFYSSHEVWLAMLGAISKQVRGVKYEIGHSVRAKSVRSKLTGKGRTIEFEVYTRYGVDDIGSCVDWLLKVNHWKGTRKAIRATGISATPLSRDELVQEIERNNKVRRLRNIVQAVWDEMEAAVETPRRAKWELS